MNTATDLRERFDERRKERARRRAEKKRNRHTSSSSRSDGCADGCWYVDIPTSGCSSSGRRSSGRGDGCDGCDGCGDGCDLNLMMLTLTSMLALFGMAIGSARRIPHAERRGGVKGLALNRIRAYQLFVSSKTPARCRMTPTCSAYASQAIEQRGLVRGLQLTVARIRSCRPGGPRGHQPVPGK